MKEFIDNNNEECCDIIASFRRHHFFRNESYNQTSSTRIVWEENWNFATKGLLDQVNTTTDKTRIQSILNNYFNRLWDLYTGDTRYYHTTVHIEEMLTMFHIIMKSNNNKYTFQLCSDAAREQSTIIILLAIFFHDCIYDGRSQTNEEDSMKLFESFADEVDVPPTIKDQVSLYILASKKHQLSSSNDNISLALFLDLDLAVLGKDGSAYNQYAALIWKEYSFVPKDIYCSKRSEILTAFLDVSQIYGTTLMQSVCEEHARANLLREIESLQNGVIPQ